MCGIAGIIGRYGNSPSLELLNKMGISIEHRGPDGHGEMFWENVAMIHRRLAIVELSEAGAQPMSYQERYSLVYNGEIYNHIELREELEAKGHQFNGKSDTEVLIHAWAEWGINCLTRFNGMWAFALLDKLAGKLWLARDRFGVKPLYIRQTSDHLLFASEIAPLLLEGKTQAELPIVADYLVHGLVDHTAKTFFRDVRRLLPSHVEEWDLKTLSSRTVCYYKPQNRQGDTKALLQDSVKLRMRADVKVGTCLSGGLDSSLVAAIAAQSLGKFERDTFVAIHASTGIAGLDESHFAQQVASHVHIDLKEIAPSPEDYLRHLNDVMRTQQEPFGSPSIVMQYFVMQEAARQGCKVMLDGQAADETFLGYPSYIKPIAWAVARRGEWSEFFKLIKHNPKSVASYPIKKMIGRQQAINTMIPVSKSRDMHDFESTWDFQISEIYSLHLQALLRYEDRNSMKHAVEARLPYMDYRLVEHALTLPLGNKIRPPWQKWDLRNAAKDILPDNISWRKDKMGFVAPSHHVVTALDKTNEKTTQNSQLIQNVVSGKLGYLGKLPEIYRWRLHCLAMWEEVFLS